MNNSLDPPALVQGHALDQRWKAFRGKLRQSAEQILLLGKELAELRRLTPHGEWLSRLSEAGISTTSAYRWIAAAESEACGKFVLLETDDEDETQDATPATTSVDSPPPKTPPANFPQGTKPAIIKPAAPQEAAPIFCRNCRVRGPKPNCPDCRALRSPREAGVDDPGARSKRTKAKGPKQGSIIFDSKLFGKQIGAILQTVDHVARCCGLVTPKGATKETPEVLAIRQKLKDLAAETKEWASKLIKSTSPAT